MSATGLNLDLYKNQNFILNLNVRDSNGAYLALSGYSVSGYAKYKYSSAPILNFNPTIYTGYASGLIEINVSRTGLSNLPENRYPYEIYIFTNPNNVTTVLQGNLYVHPNIPA